MIDAKEAKNLTTESISKNEEEKLNECFNEIDREIKKFASFGSSSCYYYFPLHLKETLKYILEQKGFKVEVYDAYTGRSKFIISW